MGSTAAPGVGGGAVARPASPARRIALSFACLAILFPLWIVVVTSLSSRKTIDEAGGLVMVPKGITFIAYEELLSGGQVTRAAIISILVTLVGTLFSMTVSVLCAYGLSRSESLGHRWILMTLLATMFFSAGLIPTYLLVQSLGLTDSYLALILPSAISVFNILVLRGFFMGISQELIDSARIDGAGDLRILWQIVMPLSRAVLAVITLFYAVGYWSAWFNASLYLNRAGHDAVAERHDPARPEAGSTGRSGPGHQDRPAVGAGHSDGGHGDGPAAGRLPVALRPEALQEGHAHGSHQGVMSLV